MTSPRPREWDAASYQRVSLVHQDWRGQVLGRLDLRGDETVLDLGIGTGLVAERLVERLPRGRVIGVDGSAAMLAAARERLGDGVALIHADLLDLELDEPADAAVSSATFHWIADHDALFQRIRAALKPGAPFVAQCGGQGNIAAVRAALDRVGRREPFAAALDGWPGPWNFAGPQETRERLERVGFAVEDCFLSDSPTTPEDPRAFLATVVVGSHLDRLAAEHREAFLDALLSELGEPVVVDYVRLNWIATAR